MDGFLNRALANGEKPFDGVTASSSDLVQLPTLAHQLRHLFAFLRSTFPDVQLLGHADWHEHDGYLTTSVPTDWAALDTLASSAEALYQARPGDDFVRIGVYEPSGLFYLRIWVLEEDDDPDLYPGRWGTFDLTATEQVVGRLVNELAGGDLTVSQAKPYFDMRRAE